MDGDEREGGKSDLEGQRSRVETGERKMSSVALTPFFMKLPLPLHTHTTFSIIAANVHKTYIQYLQKACHAV